MTDDKILDYATISTIPIHAFPELSRPSRVENCIFFATRLAAHPDHSLPPLGQYMSCQTLRKSWTREPHPLGSDGDRASSTHKRSDKLCRNRHSIRNLENNSYSMI